MVSPKKTYKHFRKKLINLAQKNHLPTFATCSCFCLLPRLVISSFYIYMGVGHLIYRVSVSMACGL
jgi:hypothetical protein